MEAAYVIAPGDDQYTHYVVNGPNAAGVLAERFAGAAISRGAKNDCLAFFYPGHQLSEVEIGNIREAGLLVGEPQFD